MKELYIQDKRVTLSDGTYFPFTQKVTDLDDVTIIGVPATKSIDIPRCIDNDEIFGNIADIHRLVVGDADEKVCISFNQIKKATYKLYNNSEIISEGIIKITAINDDNYTIELYDKILNLLEEFSGDDINNEGFLSSLDLTQSGSVVTYESSSNTVNSLNSSSVLIPTINNKEFKNTGVDALLYNTTLNTLPYELTPLQFNSFKDYQVDYARPISAIITDINYRYANSISYDSSLNTLFSELHLLLGEPKSRNNITTISIDAYSSYATKAFPSGDGSYTNYSSNYRFKTSSAYISRVNGKYIANIPVSLRLTPIEYTEYITFTDRAADLNDGDIPGSLFIDYSFVNTTSATTWDYSTLPNRIEIKLIVGDTLSMDLNVSDDSINYIDVDFIIPVNIEYYAKFGSSLNSALNISFSKSVWESDIRLFAWEYYDSGLMEFVQMYPSYTMSAQTLAFDMQIKNFSEFSSKDTINGQNLYPKVPIKDFIITLAKTFNLNLNILDGKLHLSHKVYSLSNETPIISEISNIEISNFDFSRITMNNKLPNSDIIKGFNDEYLLDYAVKVINTGYNIKEQSKEIVFDSVIPIPIKDASYFGYGEFTNYGNGGYRRSVVGDVTGIKDELCFGYLITNTEDLYINEDSAYESAMIDVFVAQIPTEKSFILRNEALRYSTKYYYDTFPSSTKKLTSWKTFVPYKINGSGIITESLEMNKPLYNYAGFTDTTYPGGVNLYDNYHKKVVEEAYNVNTHILSVTMWIDKPIDIYKIYNYKNTYYRIIEITEYDPTEAGLYEIKLMRVNNLTNYGL